jgi:hypothetical protein
MKFKEDRPLASIEAAERRLLELASGIEADHAGRLPVGIINAQFREAGGSYQEYRAAVAAAIEHGLLVMHTSGRIFDVHTSRGEPDRIRETRNP